LQYEKERDRGNFALIRNAQLKSRREKSGIIGMRRAAAIEGSYKMIYGIA